MRKEEITWYTPEEKLPPEGIIVALNISGKMGRVGYEHALVTGAWCADVEGWMLEYIDTEGAEFTVHEWADIWEGADD